MLVPESFSCLILEMWTSEIYRSLTEYEKLGNRDATKRKTRLASLVAERSWSRGRSETRTLLDGLRAERAMTLQTILEERKRSKEIRGYSLELYKVWLLLIEVIDFAGLVDSSSHLNFEFKSRDVSPQAVSARHWYKTASKFIDSLAPERLESNWIPVRLPGHFSVRADWFLAVAGGSRSSRLADHALDLLSSQRSNITRLQEGIGLPTRLLFGHDSELRLRTRLISAPSKGMPLVNVEYEDLRKLGARANRKDEEFYWLWRSGISAYNRHSRIWHKWLNRSLLWWHSWRQLYGSNWTSGFEVYDKLDAIEFKGAPIKNSPKLKSWEEFSNLRNILIAELERVSIPMG